MGLSIIEAVKSGKPYRRKGEPWRCRDNKEFVEDILATDWEIEERKIEITESEFNEVWNASDVGPGRLYDKLKKRLFK